VPGRRAAPWLDGLGLLNVGSVKNLLHPWRSARTFYALGLLCTDLLMGWLMFSLVIALLSMTIGLAIVYPLATITLWLLFLVGNACGRLERSRIYGLLGIGIGCPHQAIRGGSWWSRTLLRLRSGSRWKEIAYLLTTPLWATPMAVLALCLWAGSLLLISLPVVAGRFPGGSAELGLGNVGPGWTAWAACAIGLLVLVLAAPWLTLGFGAVRGLAATTLLGPGRDAAMRQRLQSLETSRSAAVGSAEAERRRIERDLHDGAQQRLVALAMDLGRAKARFDEDPEGARELLSTAHDEAKAALAELRDLVRGIHPAILSDRGLDAALSAAIARSPIPVQLHVDVLQRPDAAVESAAYFVVTEALVNVIKHASASHVRIEVASAAGRLVIEVHDDGAGGADPTGSGLSGLSERVVALGGTLRVISPHGGPTSILVEIPCVS
jgi:signal transduction histidine kinase